MKNIPKNNFLKKNNQNGNKKNQSQTNNSFNLRKNNKRSAGENKIYKSKGIRNRDDVSNKYNSNDRRKDMVTSSNKKNLSNKLNTKFSSSNAGYKNKISENSRNLEDWIWGKHSVYASLNSDRPINRIWCTSEIFSSEKFYLLLKEYKSKGVLIEEVSWSRLSQLTFGAVHQGIALQVSSSHTLPLDKLIDISKTKSQNPIIIALDGITDPHNLGAIIRSAEAFDCKGIIIPQRRSAGLTGAVAKVAAGALEHIPVSRVINLNRSLEQLKNNGFVIAGLTGEGKMKISEFSDPSPLVLIVGAEDKGISLLTQKKCDFLLRIPLRGKTSSLNASVAAAVAMFYLTNK